jgi:hypothetical protein
MPGSDPGSPSTATSSSPAPRFSDDDRAGRYVPGALDRAISAGVTIERRRRLFGSLRVRHFGPRPVTEEASVESGAKTIWNGKAGYRLSRTPRVVLGVFGLFDARVSAIDYFYVSRTAG